MENVIITVVLVLVLAFALVRTGKHFRGGGCCGSGGSTIRDKKVLTAPKQGEKTLTIQGMTCENCEIRVENALNRLPGVAAKVRWKRKTARVEYSQAVPDELLRQTVENLGYAVTDIK